MKVQITKRKPIIPPPTVEFVLTRKEATFARDVFGKFSWPALREHLNQGQHAYPASDADCRLNDQLWGALNKALLNNP